MSSSNKQQSQIQLSQQSAALDAQSTWKKIRFGSEATGNWFYIPHISLLSSVLQWQRPPHGRDYMLWSETGELCTHTHGNDIIQSVFRCSWQCNSWVQWEAKRVLQLDWNWKLAAAGDEITSRFSCVSARALSLWWCSRSWLNVRVPPPQTHPGSDQPD